MINRERERDKGSEKGSMIMFYLWDCVYAGDASNDNVFPLGETVKLFNTNRMLER